MATDDIEALQEKLAQCLNLAQGTTETLKLLLRMAILEAESILQEHSD